jgi:hypothetical protein
MPERRGALPRSWSGRTLVPALRARLPLALRHPGNPASNWCRERQNPLCNQALMSNRGAFFETKRTGVPW